MSKSNHSHAILEKQSRHEKSKKIISILNKFVKLSNSTVLDIGTGAGYITHNISKECKAIYSVDLHDERRIKEGYFFKKVNDEYLPFEDNSFDIIISNHVIEHINNQELHISEAHRVLKSKGFLYLATPNKYRIIEPHHKLPILSWFPKKLRNKYLKLFKNKESDIYPFSLNMLKKILEKKFEVYNITPYIIKYPNSYNLDIMKNIQPLIKLIPLHAIKKLKHLFPTHILILKKK